ncbi:MAG: T9SS type A sorting domain-containing protein [Bacteroidia bacterium]|nr:T9SS type A sorting domain-containing protein [Bacteroidia bacterium]
MFNKIKFLLLSGKKAGIIFATFCSFFLISKANAQTSGTYVILTSVSDTTDAYYQAVQALSDYRSAQVIQFDPANVNAILPVLINVAPRYVAVVVKPIELHINFIRQFLMMSANLDDDPFSDFSYGFITGATAQDALVFVNNIIYAESQNIQNYPLNIGGYAASSINFVYTSTGDYMKFLNPPSYSNIYMETSDSGSGLNFFLSNTNYMLNKKILDIGHNGDPHMLWLFEGGNTNPNPPVWNFDSTKIEDTAYARVGLTSYDISALNLYPAVAFNGACHSGEPKTVMVEGDIAATFGETNGYTEFYTMSDTFSFALSILKTGITGYFAPCGANNANDQGEDVYNAFLYHEPLGDIHKRSNDGVVMGFLGNRPNLKLYTHGEYGYGCDVLSSGSFNPNDWSGACYMLGGKANRIYFGDPLFDPYASNHSDSLNITKTVIDSVTPATLNINLSFKKPDAYDTYFPVWEKFHYGNTRIYAPVELPGFCGDVTDFEVISASGAYDLVIHAVEHFDGKTILHIEVDIPNDMYSAINYTMKFRITFINTGTAHLQNTIQNIKVYPNPSKNFIMFQFSNPGNKNHTLTIYDAKGQIVRTVNEIKNNAVRIDNTGLNSGLYFYQLQNNNGITGYGKFVIE